MVDHAVPLRVIIDMMLNRVAGHEVERTRTGILEHLCRWYHLGVITSDEDAPLNREGLRSQMPIGWDFDDVFARYRAVGIEPSLRPLTE